LDRPILSDPHDVGGPSADHEQKHDPAEIEALIEG